MSGEHRLVRASAEQWERSWEHQAPTWGQPFSVEVFKLRERTLAATAFSQENIIPWVLVPRNNTLTLDFFCSCETYSRQIAVNGQIKAVFSVASVFTPEHSRKKGYAAQMMTLLHAELRKLDAACSVLYSDVGDFYARCKDPMSGRSWQICSPVGIEWRLDELNTPTELVSKVNHLTKDDLAIICKQDTRKMHGESAESNSFAILPTGKEVEWLLTRSDFYAQRMDPQRPIPSFVGGQIQNGSGDFALWWCDYKKNCLEILRLRCSDSNALKALLHAAKSVAEESGMKTIYAWDVPESALENTGWVNKERDESRPAIVWYDDGLAEKAPRWLAVEKYGSC